MNATTKHTPGPDFPATLAFDSENAVLAAAGNGWFAAIACDSTLHRGGVGAEIARRWNAHHAMLAALEAIMSGSPAERAGLCGAYVTLSGDTLRAAHEALRLARGS